MRRREFIGILAMHAQCVAQNAKDVLRNSGGVNPT